MGRLGSVDSTGVSSNQLSSRATALAIRSTIASASTYAVQLSIAEPVSCVCMNAAIIEFGTPEGARTVEFE